MAKFCAKGHQMEDSWDTCPTCQTTGYRVASNAGTAKTRLESEPAKDLPSAGRRLPRRLVFPVRGRAGSVLTPVSHVNEGSVRTSSAKGRLQY